YILSAQHITTLLFDPLLSSSLYFFFFTDTAPTEIYTLSLHDALPILFASILGPAESAARQRRGRVGNTRDVRVTQERQNGVVERDRKSTRLNSSHVAISYAVFCLKKKK